MKTTMPIEITRWYRMISLINEVIQQHSDDESPDYNECDHDPCAWCTQAKEAINLDKPIRSIKEHLKGQ